MLNASTVAVSATLMTGGGGTITPDIPTYSNIVGAATVTSVPMSTTPQAVVIAQGQGFLSVQMPAGNAIAVWLKGATGDTGVPIHQHFGIQAFPIDTTAGAVTVYLVAASVGANAMTVEVA